MRYVEQPHREGATGPHFRYRAPIGASWPSRPAGTSAGGRRRVRTAQPSLLATRATGPVGAAHGVYLEPPGRSPQPSGHCRRPFPSGHDAALLAGAQQLWCLQISALVTAARSDAAADRSLVFYPPSHPPTAQNVRARALPRVSATLLMRLPAACAHAVFAVRHFIWQLIEIDVDRPPPEILFCLPHIRLIHMLYSGYGGLGIRAVSGPRSCCVPPVCARL